MAKKTQSSLEELEALEKQGQVSNAEEQNQEENSQDINTTKEGPSANIVDGWKPIDKNFMPYKGMLYPSSWAFAYRCPTSKEVANFSTINEKDQPAIIQAIEDLIRKCVMIIDTDKKQKISASNINDGDKMFFMLLIRDFYLPGNPINFPTMCLFCKDSVEATFGPYSLKYKPLTDKMLACFDGRVFHMTGIPGVDQEIDVHVPTLETSAKILRYIVKVFRDSQSETAETKDTDAFDKQFLLVAPFLFETGEESIPVLKQKFRKIIANENMLKAYVNIANQLKLDNLETFEYTCSSCESVEEAQLKFPGGWKNFFINKGTMGGYF